MMNNTVIGTDNKKMSPAEYIKYLADNHIKIELPEDNSKYPGQQCQDVQLNNDFRELHKKIVNEVIQFCVDHNIVIDEFHLNADCLEDSIKFGEWSACTDSGFRFDKFTDKYKDAISMKKYYSGPQFEFIKLQQKPYLFSM